MDRLEMLAQENDKLRADNHALKAQRADMARQYEDADRIFAENEALRKLVVAMSLEYHGLR